MWNKTLDPHSPDFTYTEAIEVAASAEDEDCDAIDAGLFIDPTTGRLWCTYGTYFGFIRIIELDPRTGARVEGNEPVNVAIDCEATTVIWRDGWYYLLGTHGTCCDGANSTYNIVVGRSRNVTGPYLDNMGRDMLAGGGKMVIDAADRQFGAGHFGRYIEDEGVEKMSFHWEADLDRSGRYALELAVDFVRHEIPRSRFWMIDPNEEVVSYPNQTLEEVIGTWPEGDIPARIGDWMNRPHQRWAITAVPEAGGYLGGQHYKICIEGTERTLAASEGAEVVIVPAFTGAPEQLWRIEQLTDGTFRIMPKDVQSDHSDTPDDASDTCYVLSSAADSTPTLARYDFSSDNCKWKMVRK